MFIMNTICYKTKEHLPKVSALSLLLPLKDLNLGPSD